MSQYKKCSKCKETKLHSAFNLRLKSGDLLRSNCKECCKTRYYENMSDPTFREKERKRGLKYDSEHREARRVAALNRYHAIYKYDTVTLLFKHAKYRAIRKKLPFTITKDDIILSENCPILGMKLEPGDGKLQPSSPTLDRIIPELGYVPGNIAVISHRANAIKNDANVDELQKVVQWLHEQLGE